MKAKKKDLPLSFASTAESTSEPVNEAPESFSFLQKMFKRKENVFIQLIIQQAAITLAGLEDLQGYVENQSQAAAAQLTAHEKEADEVRRILINELNKTFVTPFDREDIFSLSRAIDDVLDYAYSTVTEMEMFKVKPTQHMQVISGLLRDAANELYLAVMRLQEHKDVASDHVQRAKSIENRVEEAYRLALAELFANVEDVKGVVKVMKLREVYRHLSNAADRGDEAANVIADIIVKTM
jgi:uncharacterized protein